MTSPARGAGVASGAAAASWTRRLLFVLVLAVVPLELAARLWVYFDPASNVRDQLMTWDPDPELMYRPKPGVGDAFDRGPINSVGLRGPEIDPLAPHRVLLIGDSVAFGIHVPESRTMAACMRRQVPPGWSILNAGVAGYSTWQERRYLEKLDGVFAPTSVVVVYCSNDAWRFSQEIAWSEYYRRGEAVLDAVEPSRIGLLSAARHLTALREVTRIKREVERTPPDDPWKGEWTEAWLDLLVRAARGGRPALAALVPNADQVAEHDTATSALAAELARDAGVEVVDLLPTFRAHAHEALFLAGDAVHLSPSGHALAADAILAALPER